MPHIFDLPTAQAQELAAYGLAAIRAKVTFETRLLPKIATNPDGSIDFGANYLDATLDVTKLLQNKAIVVRSAIPPLPTEDGKANQQGAVTIQVDNTARYWAVLQDEGVLDGSNIQDSIFNITATCGPMPELQMYRGKVEETPEEEEGKTTFRTRSILWDIIDVPLVLENQDGGAITPDLYVDDTLVNVPSVVGGITYHHGVAVFDQYGDIATSVDNDGPEKILLKRVNFQRNDLGEAVPLGKFTLSFISPQEFELTQPDGLRSIGSPYGDFSAGFVSIPETAWDINPQEDITGVKIEFNTYYTADGNPWTLCKHLLYKALADDWGGTPAEPTSLPVDWDAFTAFESAFPSVRVFFCETNDENEVFSPNVPAKPKRIKDILQKILDHVGCQLTFTPDGKVSCVSSLYTLPPFKLRTYTGSNLSSGSERKASHSIFADGPKFDRMVIRYGLNPVSDDYGARKVEVTPTATTDKFNTYEVALDYFKLVRSDRFVNRLARVLFPIAATSNRRLKMSLLPNFGLPVQPGDKFQVNFTIPPVLPNTRTNSGQYWMAYSVRTRIGDVVQVEAIEIGEPVEGGRLCENFVLCQTALC